MIGVSRKPDICGCQTEKRIGMKRNVNMLSGSITKGLLALSIPVIVMNVLQNLFNMIDMTVLRNFAENADIAIGAIGATSFLTTLVTSLIFGVSTGANVILARNLGRGDGEAVKRSVGTAMAFVVVGSIALMLVGILGAKQFLIWTNCDQALLPDATMYFQLYFAASPLIVFCNFSGALLRAKGDSGSPMIYMTIGGVIKALASAFAVVVLKMGLLGVSIATIVSWGATAILYARAVWKKDNPIYVDRGYIRFYKTELTGMLHIGIPAGMQTALYSIANVVIQTAVNGFGKEATAGLGIANIYDGIIYNISVGAAAAVMPYMSQNIGAGSIDRAKKAMIKGIWITVLLGGGLGALSAAFSGPLSAIMSADPKVIAFSQQKMIIVSSAYFLCGINEILCAALRSLKKPMIPTVATLTYMCGARFVWVYGIYPLLPNNLSFLYLIWPIGWILSIVTLLPYYIFNMKKTEKELLAVEE